MNIYDSSTNSSKKSEGNKPYIIKNDTNNNCLKDLYKLCNKSWVPKLIPIIEKQEIEEEIYYVFKNVIKTLDKIIEQKISQKSQFSFFEVSQIFKNLINGLSFLQLNGFVAIIDRKTLLLTNKGLTCSEIEIYTEENIQRELKNLKKILFLLFNLKEETINDKNELNSLLEDLKTRYLQEIQKKEDKKELNMLLKILRKIWGGKKLDFIELFYETLRGTSKINIEHIILMMDNKAEEEETKIFENLTTSLTIVKDTKEFYHMTNKEKSIQVTGISEKSYNAIILNKKEWLQITKEIQPLYSLKLNYRLREENNFNELLECLNCFKNHIRKPLKKFIFQNSISEKLLNQAPWASYNRNIYQKKTLESLIEDGFQLIFEQENNWFSGINDNQIELVISEVESLFTNPLETFKFFVDSYHTITKKTILRIISLIEKISFENMKELEIGFEIRDLQDKPISLGLFSSIEKQLMKRPNSLDVLSLYLSTYYNIDHCLNTFADIVTNQQNLKEFNFIFSYLTANLTKSKFMDIFEDKNLPHLEKLSIGFYSWHYSNYLGDGSIDLLLNKLKNFLPKKMIKFGFFLSSGGKFENTINSLYSILDEKIFDSADIFLQGRLEKVGLTQEIKLKIIEILKAKNPNIEIGSLFINFHQSNSGKK